MNTNKLLVDLLEEYHYSLDTLKVSTEFLKIYAKEYAKLKCQELLLLVAEKAEISFNRFGEEYIDKDSILNVVDLEKFCS